MYDDLLQDLLEWYLETPSTRQKMGDLVDAEVFVTFKRRAQQLLSKQQLDDNIQKNKVLYSTDAVKRYLKGESTNRYLLDAVPIALDMINPDHKEALLSRYVDGKVPAQGAETQVMGRAHRALTAMVNLMQLTSNEDTIGSRSVVFPDTVKPAGSHGDPTANIAIMLLDQHPDFVDEYLYESPWEQVCQGAAVEPVIEFGPSGRLRLSAAESELLTRVPGLIDLFIDQRQEEWNNA
jgi:hypothetical protein